MKVLCLLVLVCVASVYEADAGWWRKATNWVGGAVGSVVGMLGKKERRRRDLSEDTDPDTMKQVDITCTEKHLEALTKDGIPLDIVLGIFSTVDKENDADNALNADEVDLFVKSLDVFKYCMEKGQKEKAL